MHIHRPYSTPVLPLVYDDALSYYETLCKLIDRINRIYSDTESIVEKVLSDMGLNGEIRFKCVLNVKDYGAKGDGSADDRLSIQEALTDCKNAGGGIVFVPAGHYVVSQCIIIGDNCILMGTGAGSIIEINDTSPYWGTTIGIVGSNTGCCNLKLLYYDKRDYPVVSGESWGALGITNCQYQDAIDEHRSLVKPDIENVIVSDIWTEGYYSLQVEPTRDAKNVIYRNIHGAGSIVSIQGGTVATGETVHGTVENVRCENIECDYFRILGGNYVNGVSVSNLNTHYILATGNNVHIRDFVCDCYNNSDFDAYMVAWHTENPSSPVGIACCYAINDSSDVSRCSLINGLIRGRTSGVPDRGLALNAYTKYLFENLNIQGFATRNVSGAAGSDTIFIGCDAQETGMENSPTGTGTNNNMGSSFIDYSNYWTSVYTDINAEVGTTLGKDIVFSENYTGTGSAEAGTRSSYIVKNGNFIFGNITALKTTGNLALNDEIATLPFLPARDIYATGFMLDLSQDDSISCPAIFKIAAATGKITLNHNSRHSPSLYNACYFTFVYSHIHPRS